ncbi:MAG: protein-L-isoaspartate(D-aspartate) O-methyltransferase [Bacteroidetes bacterium]|nr:protein-L-isoaspartate(D-aspartate) O-methyltransferase [Bacteroidota bacterium]
MQDTFRHKGLRRKLVEELRGLGIKDEQVLQTIGSIPRHWFIESSFEQKAYENTPFPIGSGQTISNPYTVAYQSELLQLKPTDFVLEIGTGSGYQATVLALLAGKVYSIERHKPLVNHTEKLLKHLSLKNLQCFYGDGFEGLPQFAPFDKIIITAAAPEIPLKLIEQLKPGGLIVLPYGEGDVQQMMRIKKKEDLSIEKELFEYFTFVPMLKGTK